MRNHNSTLVPIMSSSWSFDTLQTGDSEYFGWQGLAVSLRLSSCRDHLAFRVLTPRPASACKSPASRLAVPGRPRCFSGARLQAPAHRRNEARLRIAGPTARRPKIASRRLFDDMNCHGRKGTPGLRRDVARRAALRSPPPIQRAPIRSRRLRGDMDRRGTRGRAGRDMAPRRCQRHRSAAGPYAFDAAGPGAPIRATTMPARLVERCRRHARRGHRTEWRGSIRRALQSRFQSPTETRLKWPTVPQRRVYPAREGIAQTQP